MAERHDDPPAIIEIEALRAPARSDAARQQLTERILAAAEPLLSLRREPVGWWDVLAGWAKPGLVAASLAFIIAAGALLTSRVGQRVAEPVTLDEVLALSESGEMPALLVSLNEPDAEAFAAAALMEGAPDADALESVNRGEINER
jgi:hypothetical protein